MIAPNWATELLKQVCKDERKAFKRAPRIDWGVSKIHKSSSGHFQPYGNTIRVLAGTSGEDHKQVLLHEISHWLTKPKGSTGIYFYGQKRKKRNWHGKRFYVKLNALLLRYNALTQEYREREGRYKTRSRNWL